MEAYNKFPPEEALIHAKAKLELIWGVRSQTNDEVMKLVLEGKPVPEDNSEALWDYVLNVEKAWLQAAKAGDTSVLETLDSIRKMVKLKVPHLSKAWCKKSYKIEQMRKVTFADFLDFLQYSAGMLHSTFGEETMKKYRKHTETTEV